MYRLDWPEEFSPIYFRIISLEEAKKHAFALVVRTGGQSGTYLTIKIT